MIKRHIKSAAFACLLASLVASTPSTRAADLPFDMVIGPGSDIAYHSISNSKRVLMSGGHISFLDTRDSSYFSMHDGDISHVAAYDQSVFETQGGEISHVRTYGQSSAILDGSQISHTTAHGSSHIDIIGGGRYGFVTANGLDFVGSTAPPGHSTANVYDGIVGVLRARDGGVVNLHGGTVGAINPFGGGTSNLYGGMLSKATLNPDSVTNAYGADFELTLLRQSLSGPIYQLTGRLSDGSPLDAELYLPDGAVLNLITIPEPCTAVLSISVLFLATSRLRCRQSRRAV